MSKSQIANRKSQIANRKSQIGLRALALVVVGTLFMACSPKQAVPEPESAAVKPKIDHWVYSAEGEPVLGVGCEKTPGSAICTKVWADGAGNPVDPRVALAELRKEHRSKHGALTIPTLKRLQARSDDTQVHALVFATEFEHPKLTAGESGIMFFDGTVGELRELSKHSAVQSIHLSGTPTEKFSAATAATESMAHYTKSLGRLNAQGLYAQGQAVGLLELMGSGCILKDDHEAVQMMTIQHEDPNAFACSVDADCEYFPNEFCYFAGLGRGGCVNGQCVGRHATEVASRIGSVYDSEPHHAAGVDLFVANGWTNTHPFELASRYDWFLSQNVSIINESITFTDRFDVETSSGVFGPTAQDVLADFYARRHRLTIVKAAGNINNWEAGNEQVLCHPINGICVGSTDNGGTLGDPETLADEYYDDFISPSQRWINPSYNLNSTGVVSGLLSDIERPDLVSNGEQVYVANFESEDDWIISSGTSYSTPVITGLIALEKERCGNQLPDRPEFWRSRLRNRGAMAHSLDPNAPSLYPDVQNGGGYDWKGGAGIPIALGPAESCESDTEGEDGSSWVQFDDILQEDGWTQPPSWMINIDFDPTEHQTTWEDLQALKVIKSGGSGPLSHRVLKMGTITGRQGVRLRVRSSLSFLNCFENSRTTTDIVLGDEKVHAESPTYPTAVNSDYLGDLSAWVTFDYFLCGDDTEDCYAGSTATWDNNEGFDVILEENPSDELSFYVVAQWDDALNKPLFACPAGEPMTAHHLWKTL